MLIDRFEMYCMYESNQPYLCRLNKAILAAGYYGLLRIGEMTATECNHFIKYTDVHVSPQKQCMLFVLSSSKTHSECQQPQMVKIYGINGGAKTAGKYKYCPYHIIYDYLALWDKVRFSRDGGFSFTEMDQQFEPKISKLI